MERCPLRRQLVRVAIEVSRRGGDEPSFDSFLVDSEETGFGLKNTVDACPKVGLGAPRGGGLPRGQRIRRRQPGCPQRRALAFRPWRRGAAGRASQLAELTVLGRGRGPSGGVGGRGRRRSRSQPGPGGRGFGWSRPHRLRRRPRSTPWLGQCTLRNSRRPHLLAQGEGSAGAWGPWTARPGGRAAWGPRRRGRSNVHAVGGGST